MTTEKIHVSSELMKNNKQAIVMAADKEFEALQTKEGRALFFSIGEDGVFYLTREVVGDSTGWDKSDLSDVLSQYNNGVNITAKTFVVSQNVGDNTIDIVLAVTGSGQDYLYVAQGLVNSDATWSAPITWAVMGYDDLSIQPSTIVIKDVHIAQAHSGEYIVVDILKDPSSANQFIDRYFIDPSKTVTGKIWNFHPLAANFNGSDLKSCLGKKSGQRIDGIYTLGEVNGLKELIYSPLYNPFDPTVPANPSRLTITQDMCAMAAVPTDGDYTGLFIIGGKSLSYFSSNNQQDNASAQVLLTNDLFDNVTELHVNATTTEVVVWGLNQQGEIFYTKAAFGQVTQANAWSVPVPLLTNVEQIATYLNITNSSNVIFAHVGSSDLIQLTQDDSTSMWQRRSIVLPSTDINDVLEFNTYSTHVQVTGEDSIPCGEMTVDITSTSTVSVYLNNNFVILSPSNPHTCRTDSMGVLTILQQTSSLGAVCYNMTLSGETDSVSVNPMLKSMNIIAEIKTGVDLSAVTVENSDGSTQVLVPSSVSADAADGTAQAMQQFTQISVTLPQDGTVKSTSSLSATQTMTQSHGLWGMAVAGSSLAFYSGSYAVSAFNMTQNSTTGALSYTSADSGLTDISEAISSTAGDMISWLKHAWDDVSHFFIQVVDDVSHFFIEVAGKLYNFALDCVTAVINTVELVISKIEVFFEDLIKWLGFLFQWSDILRTHDVLKSLLKNKMQDAIDQIDSYKDGVHEAFSDVETRINEWAELDLPGGSLSASATAAEPSKTTTDPQNNYGVYHMNNGTSSATTSANIIPTITDELSQLLSTLKGAIETEGDIIEGAYNTIKTQIIDQITTLSIDDIVKRLVAVLADVLVETVENIAITALNVLEVVVQGVLDILDAEIDIPVLSWLYEEITGSKLSLLDASCLVVAIPATLIYKIANNATPYPDDAATTALINASSWSDVQAVFTSQPLALNSDVQPMMLMATTSGATDSTVSATSSTAQADHAITVEILRVVACFGALVFIPLSVAKKADKTSKGISVLHGIFFFVATAPNLAASLVSNSKQTWDKVLGEVIYGVTALQKLGDIFTYKQEIVPFWKGWAAATKPVDAVLGVCGMVSVIGSVVRTHDVIGVTSAITNTCWNCNRIMTPFSTDPKPFAVKMGLIGAYSIGQFVLMVETSTNSINTAAVNSVQSTSLGQEALLT
jgi:hypothetical protein